MGLEGTIYTGRFGYTILHVEDGQRSIEDLGKHVKDGLSKPAGQKTLSSQYFYDDKGSQIYQQITELKEYYPTKCEFEILSKYGEEIVSRYMKSPEAWVAPLSPTSPKSPSSSLTSTDDESNGSDPEQEREERVPRERARVQGAENGKICLVELGAGDGHKTRILLRYLLAQGVDFEYIPIDISRQAIQDLLSAKEEEFANTKLECHGLVADHKEGLEWLDAHRPNQRRFVLFLGSSIGNYDLPHAKSFLADISKRLRSGDQMLIGFDLKKDPNVLQLAYSDPYGVTANFNYNLLERINRELDANFDLAQFHHQAFYNPKLGTMESWLLSKREQSVYISKLNLKVCFDEYEGIHTEYSFKYTPALIRNIALESGWRLRETFTDEREYFMDAIYSIP
eukprot:CAMPEP_0184691772 /NCGR_PEP_ID=MMETSP0313-20130426/512_1 /TAXON_ID=2792 /ORGANISM="Porphyridium aerugineum, Strain SAG 1380-2" /LENGTH=395 /DNA_ID=CAMNT_0027149535 /DNA_START=148 /DNA_END=1335 /DNA_ORIENTATION=-